MEKINVDHEHAEDAEHALLLARRLERIAEIVARARKRLQLVAKDATPSSDAAIQSALTLIVQECAELTADIRPHLNTPAVATRNFGSAAGRVHLAADFDAPLDDFAEYA